MLIDRDGWGDGVPGPFDARGNGFDVGPALVPPGRGGDRYTLGLPNWWSHDTAYGDSLAIKNDLIDDCE
jgi:hypothetical protein